MASTQLGGLDRNSYETFLASFRNDWLANKSTAQQVVVDTGKNQFLYRNSDLYVVGVRAGGGTAPFRMLSEKDDNYNRMKGEDKEVSFAALDHALKTDYTGSFDSWSGSLRLIALMTSEAAKSHTVAYIIKKILDYRYPVNPKWYQLKELLTNWDHAAKLRGDPITTPLEYENYVRANVNLSDLHKGRFLPRV